MIIVVKEMDLLQGHIWKPSEIDRAHDIQATQCLVAETKDLYDLELGFYEFNGVPYAKLGNQVEV